MERVTYTVTEIARATGLSASQIRQEITDGVIPASKEFGRWLIPAWWLRQFADAARQGA